MLIGDHGMDFAGTVADRMIFMNEGQNIEVNAPNVLFDSTATDRAATLIVQVLHHL